MTEKEMVKHKRNFKALKIKKIAGHGLWSVILNYFTGWNGPGVKIKESHWYYLVIPEFDVSNVVRPCKNIYDGYFH